MNMLEEIILEMIEELNLEAGLLKPTSKDVVWAKFLTIFNQIKILEEALARLDKQREANIIALQERNK